MIEIYNILLYIITYLVYYINISFLLEKNRKLYIFLIGLIFFIPSIFIPSTLRIFYQQIILIFIFYLLSRNMKKTIAAVIFNYFILLFIDVFCSTILALISFKFVNNASYICNLIILILSYILIRRRLILQLWDVVQSRIEKYIYFIVLMMVVLIYISIGYKYKTINISILIVSIIFLTCMLVYQFVKTYVIRVETEKMIKYIDIYEKHINELRINQHEYKNALLCIKGMIPDNKKVSVFINNLIMENSSEDYEILRDVLKVDFSPVKGLLYHKLFLCREKNINSILNVSSNVNFKKLNKLDINTISDITKVVGIFIDNAIEACQETKQRSLSIYLYEEDNVVTFQISNTFQGTLNIDLLYKTGYSTKGKNHGYGLALAKKTINLNNKLNMKSEIHDDVFVQYLNISIKKI